MERFGVKIWINVSLCSKIERISRVKIVRPEPDGTGAGYEKAFLHLKEACKGFVLDTAGSSAEVERLVFKAEDRLEKDEHYTLNNADELEGLLDMFEWGRGVRIIIVTREKVA